MADPGICYCGNYGGGKHTKSARCPESMDELRDRIAQLQADKSQLTLDVLDLVEKREKLEAENQRLQSERDDWHKLADQRSAEIVRLDGENERLRADCERLDWLEERHGHGKGKLRPEIDTARGAK